MYNNTTISWEHRISFLLNSILTFTFVLILFSGTALADQRKVALVIGNNDYLHAPKLRNAGNDARAIATALKAINFHVILAENLNLLKFAAVLQDFSNQTENADISLVYYAGHGIQVDGTTYIVPTDAQLKGKKDLKNLIPAARVLNGSAKAKNVSIVILDACRDNPLSRSLSESRSVSRSTLIGRGLAKIDDVPRNTLVAYATQAGNVALDGHGQNSPYATAIIRHISQPNRDIRMVFGSVRDHVLENTRLQQEPFIYGSLGGKPIYLHTTGSTPSKVSVTHAFKPVVVKTTNAQTFRTNEIIPITNEFATWQHAKQSNDWALVEQLRIEYPNSIYGIVSEALLQQQEADDSLTVSIAISRLSRLRVNFSQLSADAIRTVQKKLSLANYYSGSIDGKNSRMMKNALYAFIRDSYRGGFVSYHSILALSEIADLGNSAAQLSGLWSGQYSYPRGTRAPVRFKMNLVLSQGKIYGDVSEPNTFGRKTSKNLYANFQGKIQGNKVSWIKKYDGTGGVRHSVRYKGTLDRGKRRITGTWHIGSGSGSFYIALQ
ncbi:MAG: caspase family protein [Methyloligellaceae bacterium]